MEQVVSRFESFLKSMCIGSGAQCYGLLIHDSNETFAKKHTNLMMEFHKSGTLWTEINQIIETPLFVDSRLTSMIQIADVCSYALRRYAEKDEIELFDLVFKRADRKYQATVGVRHFAAKSCECKICKAHRKSSGTPKRPILAAASAPA
jgi:hypothetical protein